MAQRVMIAMALACTPNLLIADEPTTALDVIIQAQLMDLMRQVGTQMGPAIIRITHDLSVIAEMADRVAVMYAGEIVEQTSVATLFDKPLHPYTLGLISSIPVLDEVRARLEVIPGAGPNLIDLPAGCRFAPRCKACLEHNLTKCTEQRPELLHVDAAHKVCSWLYHDTERPAVSIQAGTPRNLLMASKSASSVATSNTQQQPQWNPDFLVVKDLV